MGPFTYDPRLDNEPWTFLMGLRVQDGELLILIQKAHPRLREDPEAYRWEFLSEVFDAGTGAFKRTVPF